jgi:mannose-6-phosphate isomerase-like protein (cupin superfamily)
MSIKIPKHVKTAWIVNGDNSFQNSCVKKPWGFEKNWAGFSGIHGKTIYIEKGKRTSLKYHKLKTEVLFLERGIAEVMLGDELSLIDTVGHPMKSQKMNAGDSLMVQSGCPYRILAIENCEFVEIGDNRTDPPIRIEDDYGRTDEKNS